MFTHFRVTKERCLTLSIGVIADRYFYSNQRTGLNFTAITTFTTPYIHNRVSALRRVNIQGPIHFSYSLLLAVFTHDAIINAVPLFHRLPSRRRWARNSNYSAENNLAPESPPLSLFITFFCASNLSDISSSSPPS